MKKHGQDNKKKKKRTKSSTKRKYVLQNQVMPFETRTCYTKLYNMSFKIMMDDEFDLFYEVGFYSYVNKEPARL